jgi:hypothetical protein
MTAAQTDHDTAPPRSGGELIADLVTRAPALFRKELDLLRAEMDEKKALVGRGFGLVAAGAILALTSLNVLAAALVTALIALGVATGWASLIVGAGVGLLALLLMRQGAATLKSVTFAPERTNRSIRKNVTLAKEIL